MNIKTKKEILDFIESLGTQMTKGEKIEWMENLFLNRLELENEAKKRNQGLIEFLIEKGREEENKIYGRKK